MTTRNRIFFPGNPWPEGHPIEEFRWTASVRNNAVWFDLHLRSEDYEAEREIEAPEEDDEDDFPSDWEAPGVWTNYHRCTISSTQWPNYRGFAVCPLPAFSLERIDGFEACVDNAPPADPRDNAFHIYLFSHGTVARHRIRFERIAGTDRFDIVWTGKIALSFGGDPDFDRAFTATLFDVAAPCIPSEP